MSTANQQPDLRQLQQCVPINALTAENFRELLNKTRIERVAAGRRLFQAGDNDKTSIYLLAGAVELQGNGDRQVVEAGSAAARHPLGQQRPRQCTATAKTDVSIVRVDSDLLDILLTWHQSTGVEVEEISDDQDGDWMTRLLQSPSLRRLPAANIQALFMKLEQMPVEEGEVIIRQGDEGEYYYILLEGRCQVTRTTPRSAEPIVLAELGPGTAFGEEALISENKRNATVRMLTDGAIMRLAKHDFLELMKAPLLHEVGYSEACELVEQGAAWLDVRLPSEFSNHHLPGSQNIPLFFLRKQIDKLSMSTHYIIVCDTGRRSSAAAFLLGQQGFKVSVLRNGLNSVEREDAA